MIQELFGEGAGLLGEERKISITGALLDTSPSPSPSPSSSTTTTTTTNPPSFDQQNLRCPRCDSSNTKFCYYNNYNLTQPRHFCKTCRRYWTKGGTLRNVPIGGGCRKNKSTSSASTTVGKSSAGKVIKSITNPNPNLNSEFNPILWGSPQNSQLLALLGATQSPNPNSFSTIKEERNMIGSHMMTSNSALSTGVINARPLTLDSLNQVPLWRNNQHQTQQPHHHYHHHHQQKLQQGLLMGETQNTGIQELYQRLRSSTNYNTDHSSTVLGSFVTSTSSPTLEPSPIAGEELGYWNPTFLWSNQPTSYGAFP